MADSKITALAAISTVDPTADPLVIVDVSDTSMAASGTTKKITSNQILGAGGTATLASATITGDLTVDTSTLKVDSTNNRVGIGTTNTFKPLTVQAGSTGSATINQGLVINSSAAFGVGQGVSYSSLVFSRNRSTDTSSLNASVEIFGGNASETSGDGGVLGFSTQNAAGALTERARLNSTGAFVLAGGTTTANGIGVAFPTTQSASSDANTLDDYEEGTFTVALTFGGGSTGMTTSFSTGQYTKIGRQVSVNGVLVLTAKGSSTGAAVFSGLPFANANSLDALSAVSLRVSNISYVGSIQSLKLMNTSTFNIEQLTEAGSNTALSDANFSNSSDIAFNFTYNAA